MDTDRVLQQPIDEDSGSFSAVIQAAIPAVSGAPAWSFQSIPYWRFVAHTRSDVPFFAFADPLTAIKGASLESAAIYHVRLNGNSMVIEWGAYIGTSIHEYSIKLAKNVLAAALRQYDRSYFQNNVPSRLDNLLSVKLNDLNKIQEPGRVDRAIQDAESIVEEMRLWCNKTYLAGWEAGPNTAGVIEWKCALVVRVLLGPDVTPLIVNDVLYLASTVLKLKDSITRASVTDGLVDVLNKLHPMSAIHEEKRKCDARLMLAYYGVSKGTPWKK